MRYFQLGKARQTDENPISRLPSTLAFSWLLFSSKAILVCDLFSLWIKENGGTTWTGNRALIRSWNLSPSPPALLVPYVNRSKSIHVSEQSEVILLAPRNIPPENNSQADTQSFSPISFLDPSHPHSLTRFNCNFKLPAPNPWEKKNSSQDGGGVCQGT